MCLFNLIPINRSHVEVVHKHIEFERHSHNNFKSDTSNRFLSAEKL